MFVRVHSIAQEQQAIRFYAAHGSQGERKVGVPFFLLRWSNKDAAKRTFEKRERVEMHLFMVTPSWAPSQHAHVINNTHTRFLSLQLISTLKYPSKENKPCGKACGLATFAHCPESISRRFSCVNEDQHGPYANTLEIKEVPFHVKSISRGLFVYR